MIGVDQSRRQAVPIGRRENAAVPTSEREKFLRQLHPNLQPQQSQQKKGQSTPAETDSKEGAESRSRNRKGRGKGVASTQRREALPRLPAEARSEARRMSGMLWEVLGGKETQRLLLL